MGVRVSRLLILLGVLVTASGALLLGPYLNSGQDLALIRNSLVFEVLHDEGQINAAPAARPRRLAVDSPWAAAVRAAGAADTGLDDFTRALALVKHLHPDGRRLGGMLATRSLETYRAIRKTGHGFCADYTQVFLVLAQAAGISAREWGISFVGYSGYGHALVEVYAPAHGRWIAIDVFNDFYVTDKVGSPLSLIELRERLLEDSDDLVVMPISGPELFPTPARALHYLRRGAGRAYLWTKGDVLAYEAHPLITLLGPYSRSAEQLAAIMIGIAPHMQILPRLEERAALLELYLLRIACLCLPSGLLLLVVGLFGASRARSSHAPI